MVKLKSLIIVLRHIWEVLFKMLPKVGISGWLGLSTGITRLFILRLKQHNLKYYMYEIHHIYNIMPFQNGGRLCGSVFGEIRPFAARIEGLFASCAAVDERSGKLASSGGTF